MDDLKMLRSLYPNWTIRYTSTAYKVNEPMFAAEKGNDNDYQFVLGDYSTVARELNILELKARIAELEETLGKCRDLLSSFSSMRDLFIKFRDEHSGNGPTFVRLVLLVQCVEDAMELQGGAE